MSELNAYEAFVEQFRREAAKKMAAFEHAAKQAATRAEQLAKEAEKESKPNSVQQVGVKPVAIKPNAARRDEDHLAPPHGAPGFAAAWDGVAEGVGNALADANTLGSDDAHLEGSENTEQLSPWMGSKKKGKIRGVLRNSR